MSELNTSSSCSVFLISFVLFGVYLYYEVFVQSDLRFPREGEALTMYDTNGNPDILQVQRFSTGWWLLQTHHLFGLGVALLTGVYIIAFGLKQKFLGACCAVYFFIVSCMLLIGVFWWFSFCSSRGSDCVLLRESAHNGIDVDSRIHLQVPLFYIILAVLSMCFMTPFSWVFFTNAASRATRSETKRESNEEEDDGEEEPLLGRFVPTQSSSTITSKSRAFAKKLTYKSAKNL